MNLLVPLDTTIVTNFAVVGLTSIPVELWGNQAPAAAEVLEEYTSAAGYYSPVSKLDAD